MLAGFAALITACVFAGFASAAATPADCPNRLLRGGASASLPDCRAYEQVSPTNKGAFDAVYYTVAFAHSQAAAAGERVFYEGVTPFPGAEGANAVGSGHLSVRTPNGWRTAELTPHSSGLGPTGEFFVYYPAFSEQLTQGVLKVPLALTGQAEPDAWGLYTRDLAGPAPWNEAPAYSWIDAAALPEPAKERCEDAIHRAEASCRESIEFAGASQGFTHTLFETRTHLLAQAPPTDVEELYESSAGQVRIVGVLPDGRVAAAGATGGGGTPAGYPGLPFGEGDHRVQHAISEDGERVIFQASSDEGEPSEAGQSGLTEVYDRIAGAETVELSRPAEGAKPANAKAEPAEFWAASKDGSRVFFTSSAELTSTSNTGPANEGSDLYEARLEAQPSGPPKVGLRDLTVDAADPAGARVLGVVGTSEDGEYVYFVAEGRLVAGKGVDGSPNLYMERDGGKPLFIATLRPADTESKSTEEQAPGDMLDWTAYGQLQRAYVTPDGTHLAFDSQESLPSVNFPAGYDNANLTTGEADAEVYEYTAPSASEEAAGRSGRLVCASCDPTGTRPTSNAFLAGTGLANNAGLDGAEEEAGPRVEEISGNHREVPGKGPLSSSTPFHHIRAVSDGGGRVFFTARPYASETAADREETTAVKVYEYEQDGEGSCHLEAGCVFRLSGATNKTGDIFIGASAEGGNVFFATPSQLAATDHDNLIDVVDAREYGGFPAPEAPAGCEESCQAAPGAPPSGPPLLSTLTGPPGNLPVASAPVKPAAKRAKHAKKAKRASRRHRRLLRCRRRARRRGGRHARRGALQRCARRYGRAAGAGRRHRHGGRAARRHMRRHGRRRAGANGRRGR